ncbi:MAG: Asp-tRNA(Asn)/Glu-tRNA(Gln) amidotransferase subunit GatA [Patescibacteria group bacterium]|nr:Asp-tRNA(Asn)/Glu-tRNA(Gln) amidotransferase subunit GatA [Patescibacteria group bacterium]MDD5490654.1 Asp-tRNA(Asn)/Glu-tRNA(Gln) amidotransferase subunit GatA [Patescibacteria group bacterium]
MKLNQLTIKEAHEGLKKKDFSSEELVRACLGQIKKHDKEINSFITVAEKEALADAEEIDKKIKAGEKIDLLSGIPFAVKDAICTKGIRSTAAAKILDNYIPPFDATVINRLKERGGIIIGKNNCDAFGHGASNENSDYGPVRNPWKPTRVAGGSSGGSAAAVAAEMAIYSIGEDTGGSIRQPSSFCNTVGLKVSYGRNSRYGIMPMASSLDTVGPITKNVFDAAAVLEAMAGIDPADSTTVPDKVPDYTKFLKEDGLKGIKIGLPKEYLDYDMDKEVKRVLEQAVKQFEELGAKIKEVSLPHTEYAVPVYYIVVPSEDSTNLARFDGVRYGVRSPKAGDLEEIYTLSRAAGLPAEVKRRIMIGTYALSAGYYDAYYLKAQKVRTLIKQDFEKTFLDVDVLLTPTAPTPPFTIGEKITDPLAMYLADVFVSPASVAGMCAISVPAGFSSDSLPIGIQIIGPRLGEERILNVAYNFEQATDYHKKKPF